MLYCIDNVLVCIYNVYRGDMMAATSIVNVNVNAKDKKQANEILNDLGLNMSTFVNMAIKQLIKRGTIPFEIVNNDSGLDPKTIKALQEAYVVAVNESVTKHMNKKSN